MKVIEIARCLKCRELIHQYNKDHKCDLKKFFVTCPELGNFLNLPADGDSKFSIMAVDFEEAAALCAEYLQRNREIDLYNDDEPLAVEVSDGNKADDESLLVFLDGDVNPSFTVTRE